MVNVVARSFNFRFTCRISEVRAVPRGPPVEGPSLDFICPGRQQHQKHAETALSRLGVDWNVGIATGDIGIAYCGLVLRSEWLVWLESDGGKPWEAETLVQAVLELGQAIQQWGSLQQQSLRLR